MHCGAARRLAKRVAVHSRFIQPDASGCLALLKGGDCVACGQELGYGGTVGRVVFGAFFHPGGDTRPSASMDKEHAIFEPRGDAASRQEKAEETGGEAGKRGSMEIRKAIHAKHVLESGARVIEAEWLAGFDSAMAAFIGSVGSLP